MDKHKATQNDEAIKSYTMAIEADPNYANGYYYRGKVQKERGEPSV